MPVVLLGDLNARADGTGTSTYAELLSPSVGIVDAWTEAGGGPGFTCCQEDDLFLAQGDKVVTLGHYLWRVKATEGEWESDFAHLFTVRDGRVTRFQEFTDTGALSHALGAG